MEYLIYIICILDIFRNYENKFGNRYLIIYYDSRYDFIISQYYTLFLYYHYVRKYHLYPKVRLQKDKRKTIINLIVLQITYTFVTLDWKKKYVCMKIFWKIDGSSNFWIISRIENDHDYIIILFRLHFVVPRKPVYTNDLWKYEQICIISFSKSHIIFLTLNYQRNISQTLNKLLN